jgi:hypothetical protein
MPTLETESALRALRWCEHGEIVAAGSTSRSCSGCVNGICGAALACLQAEAQPEKPARRRRFPRSSGERWAALTGAVLGLAAITWLALPFLH